jgi:hypothetical protein
MTSTPSDENHWEYYARKKEIRTGNSEGAAQSTLEYLNIRSYK